MLAWVIGAGGLLGSAFASTAAADVDVVTSGPIPWTSRDDAIAALTARLASFRRDATDTAWAVIWAAGATTVASDPTATDDELAVFTAFIDELAAGAPSGPGAVFLASSAGGVYAGSDAPPFTAATAPVPISPYGHLKLAQEDVARARLSGRVPLIIGRISNLYGPGHNPTKGQGLIPQLCLATVRRTPLNLYVSMDTVRDYLYVDDAAAIAWRLIRTAIDDEDTDPRIAVIASGQPTTVAEVIATVQSVAHRRVPYALGTHPSSVHQVIDLRVRPEPLAPTVLTPLPTGVKRVLDAFVGRPA